MIKELMLMVCPGGNLSKCEGRWAALPCPTCPTLSSLRTSALLFKADAYHFCSAGEKNNGGVESIFLITGSN